MVRPAAPGPGEHHSDGGGSMMPPAAGGPVFRPVMLDHTQNPLTTTEVAAITGFSIRTIREQAQGGRIPGAFKPFNKGRGKGKERVGRVEWRFNRTQFSQWWEQQQSPGVQIYRPMRKSRKGAA